MTSREIFTKKIEGKGPLNFVLIHNAGGDHQFFTHQIDALKKRGGILLLDLPGHGSSAPRSKNTIEDSADVIYEICQQFALKNIVLLGLNNGANIALQTCHQHDLPIHSLVLIDPPLFLGKQFIHEIHEFIDKLNQEDCKTFIQALVNNLFLKTDVSNKEIALKAFMSAEKKSLQGMFRSLIDWDRNSEKKLQAIQLPTLCLLTDEHHCSYSKICDIAPKFEVGKVIGSKCWATLEVPEQINAMIERFLTLL